MPTAQPNALASETTYADRPAPAPEQAAAQQVLRQSFGVDLTIVDPQSERTVYEGRDQLPWNWQRFAEVCREVARRGRPELLLEVDLLVVLAVPVWTGSESPLVGLGAFVTGQPALNGAVAAAASALGVHEEPLQRWAGSQTAVPPSVLERLAEAVFRQQAAMARVAELEQEVEKLSNHLCTSYEEISLIYRLTRSLNISRREEELAEFALEWMGEITAASGMAVQLLPREDAEPANEIDEPLEPQLLVYGDCPVDNAEFTRLAERLQLKDAQRPVVRNAAFAQSEPWPFAEVREVIAVPLSEGDRLFGYLAAFNHNEGGEFGTVEADLLSSVSAILGIHRGNTQLYLEQADLMANMVRALTSAIDAKDPYTRGHSERVARVAIRLAQELGCTQDVAETLYLGGLMHDVGKIGIDDNVLRKPGRLTAAEFEHIKLHPQLGYNILVGIKQMASILPIVLHHHEAWDGSGYPHGLAGEDIPYLARVTAVADAFDAMGSDRPYRKGMDEEKLDTIIREGAGTQWDPAVVEAFFRAREDIREIARGTHQDPPVDLRNCFRV